MPGPSSSKKKLGLWAATSLVVGNMIGAGIFMMPSALAAFGSISLLGWVFSAAGAFLMALVFSSLSKKLPGINGGPYAYTKAGFGDFMGFLVAWGYWISIWCTNAAIAVSFVSALSTFFPILHGAHAVNGAAAVVTGLAAIWFLTWVNTREIVASGNMQLLTTILKLLPLVAVAVGGLFFINAKNFTPFNISGQPTFSAITATAAMTLFAFLGIECATIPAGNVHDPGKTIPRATMLGTIITALVYILGTVSVLGIIPSVSLQNSVTPFADAATIIFGSHAQYWVSAGIAIAAFGALNGWILIQGQIPSAIAKDKLFPGVFGKENKRGAPANGIVIGSILVSIIMVMNYTKGLVEQFKFLMLLSTLTSLVPYLFSMAAYIVVVTRQKNIGNKKRFAPIVISFLAFVFAFWAIAGAGEEIVYWGFLLLMAGVPFYVWIIFRRGDG
ncbi:MAG: amino acid permease [Bacteroidetes bacterium]|nr:amino acid permease [Bacteroidota bacterium]MBS1972942.1 amino acid permease [Bacteroidota bacterium]